jgi:hypothetical protein
VCGCFVCAACPTQAPDRPQSPCCCPMKGSHACRHKHIERMRKSGGLITPTATRSALYFHTHTARLPRASRPPLVAHRPWYNHVDLGPSLSHSWLSLKSPESLSMHAQPCMLHPCASRNHHPGLHMHASASRAQARPGEFDQEVVCGVSVCARSRLVPLIHHQPLALEALPVHLNRRFSRPTLCA